MFHPISTRHQSQSSLSLLSPQRLTATSNNHHRNLTTPLPNNNNQSNTVGKSFNAGNGNGNGNPSIGPKQLFSDLIKDRNRNSKSIQTPSFKLDRKAFGDKTNSPSKSKLRNQGQRGGGLDDDNDSPSKSTNLAQKSSSNLNDNPFKTPAHNHTLILNRDGNGDAPGSSHSFITPQSNIGKKGLIKVRMAEMLDKEMGIDTNRDFGFGMGLKEEEEEVEMTEEEMYPEIDTLGNGEFARDPPYEFPPEFQNLPSAIELGKEIKSTRFQGSFSDSKSQLQEELKEKTLGFVGSLKENADVDGEGQDPDLGGMIKRGEENEEIGNDFEQDDLWPDVEIVEKEMKLGQGIKVGGNAQGRIGAKVGSATTTTTSDLKSRSALNTKIPSKSTTSSNSKPIEKVPSSSRTDSSKPSTSTSTSVRKIIPNVTKTTTSTSVKPTLNNNPINAKTSQPSSVLNRKPQISKVSSSSNKSRINNSNNESKPSQPSVRSSNVNVGVVRKPLSTLKSSNIMKPKTQGQGQGDEGMKKVKRVINPELSDKKIQNDVLNDWLKGNEKVVKGGMVEEEILFEGF